MSLNFILISTSLLECFYLFFYPVRKRAWRRGEVLFEKKELQLCVGVVVKKRRLRGAKGKVGETLSTLSLGSEGRRASTRQIDTYFLPQRRCRITRGAVLVPVLFSSVAELTFGDSHYRTSSAVFLSPCTTFSFSRFLFHLSFRICALRSSLWMLIPLLVSSGNSAPFQSIFTRASGTKCLRF